MFNRFQKLFFEREKQRKHAQKEGKSPATFWKRSDFCKRCLHWLENFPVRSCFFAIVIFLLLALLTPALFQARNEARKNLCRARLMQIGQAMQNYHQNHGTFPPAYTIDATGRPLHSWRTLLLPYLGYGDLYQKIRLEEPWNSPYNRQFHSQIIEPYSCPSMMRQAKTSLAKENRSTFPSSKKSESVDFKFSPEKSSVDSLPVDSKMESAQQSVGHRQESASTAITFSSNEDCVEVDFQGSRDDFNEDFVEIDRNFNRKKTIFSNEFRTPYAVILGEATLFPGERAVSLAEIPDGSSHTILVWERNRAVCWMDPTQELTLVEFQKTPELEPQQEPQFLQKKTNFSNDSFLEDEENEDFSTKNGPLLSKRWSSPHGFGHLVLFADGHVEFLRNDIEERILFAKIKRNDSQKNHGGNTSKDSGR